MTRQDVVDALNGHLQIFPNLPDVAWTAVPYVPTLPRTYLSPRLSAYTRNIIATGPDGAAQHDGSYTVMVWGAADHGTDEIGLLAGRLRLHFQRASVLNVGDTPILLLNATEQPETVNGGWVGIPVMATFTATDP